MCKGERDGREREGERCMYDEDGGGWGGHGPEVVEDGSVGAVTERVK